MLPRSCVCVAPFQDSQAWVGCQCHEQTHTIWNKPRGDGRMSHCTNALWSLVHWWAVRVSACVWSRGWEMYKHAAVCMSAGHWFSVCVLCYTEGGVSLHNISFWPMRDQTYRHVIGVGISPFITFPYIWIPNGFFVCVFLQEDHMLLHHFQFPLKRNLAHHCEKRDEWGTEGLKSNVYINIYFIP